MNAQELTRALGGRWHGSYGMAQCPTHDDGRTPALKVSDDNRKDDGIDLHCFAGCDWRDVKAELQERGLLPTRSRLSAPRRRRPRRRQRPPDAKPADSTRKLGATADRRPQHPDRRARARAKSGRRLWAKHGRRKP